MSFLKLKIIFELYHPNGREYSNEGGTKSLAHK